MLRGTVMPRLRGVNRLCSSMVAEMRIGVIQRGRKNPLPFFFFYAYAVYRLHPR